ncbi:hypothetical protein QE152_g25628 [Popillia japonica]|uniref:Uncharacterized protein n=1 Tax=Popillia japonica TaxID=7064 RepID=A0AAW1K1D3_POPJA
MLALINNLQDEIRDLKAKYSALIDSRASSGNPSNIMVGEDIINEVYERNKRSRNIISSRNIIIYGSHESGTSKQQQIDLDNVTVQNLMEEVGIQCEQIKPIRLGRFDPLDNVTVQNLMEEVGIQCEQIKPIRLGRFDPTKDPPDATLECFEILTTALEMLFVGNLFIMVGDFNLPDLIMPPKQHSNKTKLGNVT